MAYAIYLIIASLAVLLITELGKTKDRSRHMRIPTVRFSILLPNVLNRLIFFFVGSRLIHRGYKKYPSTAFRVLKADGDLIVLPRHFADELKGMGPNRLSSLDAQFENILGNYTKILVESHLPPQTVSRRLIPKLGYLTPQILNELDKAFELEFPKCGNQWTPLNPYEFFIRLLTRSTSRLLAGNEICKNEELPDLVSKYTLNMGLTLVLLRPFPDFMRPAVSWLLPSAWRLNNIMETVKASFVPVIKSRLAAKHDQSTEEKPEDYLQWLVDLCDNDRDADPNFMAHNLFIIMALAVVHTSTMALTQTMYDLVLHQSCLPALRKEIKTCLTQSWKESSLNDFHRMHRLDSFLRESQRFNPSQEVTMHRIVKSPIRLSNGLYLPEGIHICFASGPMSHDPTIIPDPETFLPFRWSDGPERKSLIAIGEENMHFGYGRQSCPGRAMASASMKMVLSRILSEHELMFEDQDKPGKVVKRPWNLRNGEQILPNPWTEVYVRKLQEVENEVGEVEKET